jgi:DNA-binding NarL/FixJ family response regulator
MVRVESRRRRAPRKPVSIDIGRLLMRLSTTCEGDVSFTPPASRARRPNVQPADPVTLRLTPRQVDTLRMLLFGASEKQVARTLKLSRHTVHVHVKAIYRSVGVSSRSELMAMFLRAALRERD